MGTVHTNWQHLDFYGVLFVTSASMSQKNLVGTVPIFTLMDIINQRTQKSSIRHGYIDTQMFNEYTVFPI